MRVLRSRRLSESSKVRWLSRVLVIIVLLLPICTAKAQTPASEHDANAIESPARVEIEPLARDHEIQRRLEEILSATGWFVDASARVQDGVVFLEGHARSEQYRKWAGDLARNTRDVAVVVNRMEVLQPPVWDFTPAITAVRELARGVVRSLPLAAFSVIVLVCSALAAWLGAKGVHRALRWRLTPFLRDVVARTAAVAIFIIGLYVVLRIAGLTTIALTVMGGTGLIGLILGVAFRGITENFLASVFLSIQKPFRTGDLVEIRDFVGYVQRLTNRATVLMTLEGNHVQIPNSTVYQSPIRNYTSNPNRREDFGIGIGYADKIAHAQKIALDVLAGHTAVLAEPEPWVLVDSLGKATVNLRVYFWLDGSKHSWLKVRSSVIRLIKAAFQGAGISMPDEAREVIFPEGVPLQLMEPAEARSIEERKPSTTVATAAGEDENTTRGEAGLHSEARDIEAQAEQARTPEEGRDLLRSP